MSDAIKHECGIALLRLLKPLEYYQQKYGSAFYGIHKMYLLLEKQHNRGQDGAGLASIKLDMQPGVRYISRVRSTDAQPVQDIFRQINSRISEIMQHEPHLQNNVKAMKEALPYIGEVFLGHIRYGTFGKNSIENVHPFLRQNNWPHRNLILAGNFNMTNVNELFQLLVDIGQHPKEKADTVTVMERIGHFLDLEVEEIYQKLKAQDVGKQAASALIGQELNVAKILRKAAQKWDGGYAMEGILGHGDAFVMRDPAGIRPAYYYIDDEIAVVTSERPAIQTAFNVPFNAIKELPAGSAIIIKKKGKISIEEILTPTAYKACSFERIYFSRGSDQEIYHERKALGKLLLPQVLTAVEGDLQQTVFSYVPNTAETSFLGLTQAALAYMNEHKMKLITEKGANISQEKLAQIIEMAPRTEKVIIKDAKLRTFITEDTSRDDLVTHIYDITYGSIVPHKDNLVVIDDSIVRGTTLKKSILKMLSRLQPKKIVVVSSAPQIRYPDCYGIDMARLEDLIAFQAALSLHKKRGSFSIIDEVYKKCKAQENVADSQAVNYVKEIYAPFSDKEISQEITTLLHNSAVECPVEIIFQSIENLHKACPKNLGDWYFTGNYPTAGGNRVVGRAFMNFYEGKKDRAY